jgi:hypothetical protein
MASPLFAAADEQNMKLASWLQDEVRVRARGLQTGVGLGQLQRQAESKGRRWREEQGSSAWSEEGGGELSVNFEDVFLSCPQRP